MKKFYKYISVLLALLALSFVVLSCNNGHSPTPSVEDIYPMEGDGDYNGTITNGTETFWISVFINAWDEMHNDGTTDKGSFFYTLFTSAEKTKDNCLGSALCEENNSNYIEINSSSIWSDEFRAISQDGGQSYALSLSMINNNTGASELFTGIIYKKAQ